MKIVRPALIVATSAALVFSAQPLAGAATVTPGPAAGECTYSYTDSDI